MYTGMQAATHPVTLLAWGRGPPARNLRPVPMLRLFLLGCDRDRFGIGWFSNPVGVVLRVLAVKFRYRHNLCPNL